MTDESVSYGMVEFTGDDEGDVQVFLTRMGDDGVEPLGGVLMSRDDLRELLASVMEWL